MHPTAAQQVQLYDWLVAKGEGVLTGDSFFHLSPLGQSGALAGLNMCGAGRVVCLIDPVGDVYACPFAIHDRFLAGNVLTDSDFGSGFANVWKNAPLFRELREPQSAGACGSCGHYDSCRGGCMAAKFFTGLPLDGPDPECVQGHSASALARERNTPRPRADHSHGRRVRKPVPLTLIHATTGSAVQRKPRVAMADEWFETVAIAQQRAKRRLPKSVYSSLLAASEKGVTVADNVEAFSELGFAPHVIGALEKRDLSTTVMGQEISLPVIISPTGVQAVDPDGEVAVARAAAARGTAMGLSSFASKPIEEVIAANPKVFFQVYWLGGRDAIAARVERARQAGAVGLIATTDWSFSHGRDWGSPKIPEEMNLRTMLRMSPEAITKPRWLWKFGKTLRPPDLRVPNQGRRGEPGPAVLRRLRGVDGHPAADLGRHRLVAGTVGRAVHAQGRDAGRRCQKSGGCGCFGDIGVQPRWQQPGRHARPRSAPCPRSPRRSATRSRCCWTAASGAAVTSSRRWRWERGR